MNNSFVLKNVSDELVTIFATFKATGERTQITDLYWFEENMVHGFNDEEWSFDVVVTPGRQQDEPLPK